MRLGASVSNLFSEKTIEDMVFAQHMRFSGCQGCIAIWMGDTGNQLAGFFQGISK